MKTELNKIAQDLDKGTITKKEARTLLLGLLIVSESTLSKHKLTIKEYGYGMYQLRQDGEYLMESEKLDCHKRAREIIEKYFH
jgi:hypothetical protein|tara:strand:- start:616 stop:864 length:249 start_codon:yes stop_codon:yes gene_type:complete